ncbi:hypothetical protein K435DRAFT_693004 [Dendrothele bispora CBS 962.96]|uniref:Uncharacterized protein n=1 Tax=Dendrothele bispora (strain CBS 962.96) TaxID=1314807 RepID=A0A4V4HC26_DENBC|nr:hypothetical protein K435DRAFT_693004 [Dendrothele bispora CBS 962.96]
MVNTSGANGHDNGVVPSDKELKEALWQYARENLTRAQRLARLESEFQFKISESTLKRLQTKFRVPSSRKPPPRHVAVGMILDEMAHDPEGRRSANTVKSMLAQEDVQIPRCNIHRVPLTTPGVNYEVSGDGHEKTNAQGLDMGGVGMDIYGIVEKCSSAIRCFVFVPSSCDKHTVGHIHLDYIEKYGVMSMQFSVDGGHETEFMFSQHMALRRERFAPEYSFQEHNPWDSRKSVHNPRSEGTWRRWRDHTGKTFREEMVKGKTNGLYHAGSYVRRQDFLACPCPFSPLKFSQLRNLFQWLWPKIGQKEADIYVNWWNAHHIRSQAAKLLPSSTTPNMVLQSPECYGYRRWDIPIPQSAIDVLRGKIPVSRDEAFRWVDDEFNLAAQSAYQEIGSPELRCCNGWDIYKDMLDKLLEMYGEDAPVFLL